MSQHPSTKSIRRILLESSLASAIIVVLQYAYWTFRLLQGFRGVDPVTLVISGLVLGVVAWLGITAREVWKSRHQA
ncbi:MAG: hypothetical protein C5B60_10715 [Chloroflexi bacterium]|nr:MAG: hypothetical protein C5B60_10715 [Chloroflexota bacterium]